jgi:flagellar hook-basal body complex protein FliE
MKVRILLIICGAAGLAFAASYGFARSLEEQEPSSPVLADIIPLVEWDLPDMVAQQQPAQAPETPVTPPPAPTPPAPAPAPAPAEPPGVGESAPEDPALPPEDATVEDDFSIGDIPVVETIELNTEKAKKALDTYVLVREKYKDAALENYENLQDFVDQSPQGKAFETDVKAAGFANVTEWNTTITTLSFAHDNSLDDQTADITQQIKELQADTNMAQDMRDRMIAALNAMIPSDNNKKVVEELKKDPQSSEKLKLLESEAE